MTATHTHRRSWAVGDTLLLEAPAATRTAIALFAGASGDHNPIHLDIDVARAAGLDDVFAQGMLSMAFLGRLLTDSFPQAALRSFSTRFTAITPVNAQPSCHGEVTQIADGELTLDLRVVLPDGTVTVTGSATVELATPPTEGVER